MLLLVRDLLREIHQSVPYHITPTSSVLEAVELMKNHHVSGLLVIDDEDQFGGIFTDKDLEKMADRRASEVKVGEVMTKADSVITVTEEDSLAHCSSEMDRLDTRHLPVMKNGQAIGMVSIKDINRLVHPLLDQLERFIGGSR